jgi:Xaa-Pro aminopeptidase
MMNYGQRRDRLRKLISKANADGMLITNFTNVSYLTGFTGEDSFLLVTGDGDLLLSDPRYEVQISEECQDLPTFIRKPSELLLDVTARQIVSDRKSLKRLLFEGGSLSVNAFDQLSSTAPSTDFVKGDSLVETLRAIKDKQEIVLLRQAIAVAERAFQVIRAQLTSRQTEREIAHELERQIRTLGGTGCSFKPIVAVGPRAALPHATPGENQIGSSPFVLIDWGAVVGGYRSDLTRVLLTTKMPPKFSKVYETVLMAQQAAISAMKPGVLVSKIDQVAREVMAAAGMDKRFNHGLGHGIGLEIHEAPRLGKNWDRPLEPGMVVTVEPGAYFPGWGGVRIEDDVLITRDGVELLSTLPRGVEDNCVQMLA